MFSVFSSYKHLPVQIFKILFSDNIHPKMECLVFMYKYMFTIMKYEIKIIHKNKNILKY